MILQTADQQNAKQPKSPEVVDYITYGNVGLLAAVRPALVSVLFVSQSWYTLICGYSVSVHQQFTAAGIVNAVDNQKQYSSSQRANRRGIEGIYFQHRRNG